MLFNSVDFAIFLPVVFIIYWFVLQGKLRLQNFFITLASYLFYGWWDWKFLSLIILSTFVDYSIGRLLEKEDRTSYRKIYLWSSIVVNLGILGFFKYYNFFLENFIQAFSLFGSEIRASSLSIILPVGISFYTFQTLSYTIDVYRKKLQPTHDFIAFSAFVSFFPQLVAGPIERALHLLPQFYRKRHFNYKLAVDGSQQIIWGLFKKMVIADNCAEYANMIFQNSAEYNPLSLIMGALFFTFQIYGDFSGYSDIAIGTARLFGFDLMRNFAYPYFSRDIAEFWRRWHISLSTWFRDYLYIPLGGSRGGKWRNIRNVFIIFIVSGFWHGANWTFIFWGFLNALYFLPLMLTNLNRNNIGVVAEGRIFPKPGEIIGILITFWLTVLAWIFFRAENLTHAFSYLEGILIGTGQNQIDFFADNYQMLFLFVFIVMMLSVEWLQRDKEHGLQINPSKRKLSWALNLVVFTLCFLFEGNQADFIYFQF
ncbi:MBOAT family O-acyltransferase [Robertkochia aurantiaca]|uniref:MBOAT family O-acyltransferase n=1 Tax=Robertkochia aurantiaca TaxID=2873700 RepID=UPI001CCE6E7B|nr:MBOAT family O-acyltransferase [Robertkochia sp. 3YJGBD-33]